MSEERVAAAMWREETVDAGTPESVTYRRTLEEFCEAGDDVRRKWLKFARAAISAIQPTAPDTRAMTGIINTRSMVGSIEYYLNHQHCVENLRRISHLNPYNVTVRAGEGTTGDVLFNYCGDGGYVDAVEAFARLALIDQPPPSPSTPDPTKGAGILKRLKEACNGTPAKVQWPHRLFHDAIAEIEECHRNISLNADWIEATLNDLAAKQPPPSPTVQEAAKVLHAWFSKLDMGDALMMGLFWREFHRYHDDQARVVNGLRALAEQHKPVATHDE